jgi:hypothetical protein
MKPFHDKHHDSEEANISPPQLKLNCQAVLKENQIWLSHSKQVFGNVHFHSKRDFWKSNVFPFKRVKIFVALFRL